MKAKDGRRTLSRRKPKKEKKSCLPLAIWRQLFLFTRLLMKEKEQKKKGLRSLINSLLAEVSA